ncbi:MAG: DUF6398 domain-containing protein [Firmicutes bacterium]|nr:DUF6398 domain-containing protein [Bacillota bacterium]
MAIPKTMQAKYDEIAPLIVVFCDEKLNDDYKALCLRLLEKLCRKRPSPLLGGRAHTWAAGIAHAIGTNNFIFDKSQDIHMTAGELAAGFGLSVATTGQKSKEIRDMFKITYGNCEWLLPELIEDNPMIWMVMVNGLYVDIRDMPLEVQQLAFEKKIIPYVPGEREGNQICRMTIIPGEKPNDP